jgi:hypothetical protein
MIQHTALARSTKPILRKRSKPRRGPVMDVAYLEWLRTLPCCVCIPWHVSAVGWFQVSPTEAAHVGARGLGQRCDDREALPICERHHRTGPLAHHVLGKKFWTYHGFDREKLIAEYNRKYQIEVTGLDLQKLLDYKEDL